MNYSYDGNGLRVAKSSGTVFWRGTGGSTLAESNATGGLQNEYIFFNGARIASRDSSGNVFYFFSDHLGSIRAIANSTGTTCYQADFTPYGGELTPANFTNTCSPNYRFTGYEYDSELNLNYALARYYSSSLARFLSVDPIDGSPEDSQSWNKYTYVRNDPSNSLDPGGLDDEWGCSYCFSGILATGWNSMGGGTAIQWESGGIIFPNGDYSFGGDLPNVPWWSPFQQSWTSSGNLFHTPTMDERGMGQFAAALPLAADRAAPGVNLASTALELFGSLFAGQGMEAPVENYSFAPSGFGAEPKGNFYSVAFEMKLNPSDFGKARAVHFNRASAALDAAIRSDTGFSAQMEEEIPGVAGSVSSQGGRKTPLGWTWHHGQEPGVMQLVPKEQHQNSLFWDVMHPGGLGGYAKWAIPAGAPPNK